MLCSGGIWRNGNLLDASSLLYRPYGSLPIPEGQWLIEAHQLFETSLALAHFEARNIALGLYANVPGYVKSNESTELCDKTFLLNANGYKNVGANSMACHLCPFHGDDHHCHTCRRSRQ